MRDPEVLLLKKNECDGASRHVRLWAHAARNSREQVSISSVRRS